MATPSNRRAYTMMELAIVLMILGVLVGIATPKLLGSSEDTAVEATILQLKTIVAAVEAYHNDHGEWPPDGSPGNPPSELDAYLRPNVLVRPCPIGGQYDVDIGHNGVTCAISVMNSPPDRTVWEGIDAQIDDGDPDTGWVLLLPQRMMFVIEP